MKTNIGQIKLTQSVNPILDYFILLIPVSLLAICGDEAVHRRPTNERRDASTAEAMTTDMEALLSKLSAVIEAMSSIHSTSGDGKAPSSAAYAHTLQRHSEILHDYQQEFRKTRSSFAMLRERSELLAGADRSRGPLGAQGIDNSTGLDALYKERASISAATAGADTTIATGLSLKEDLDRQRAMFASMVERMETMSEGLPAVNRLIGQIRRKKKRDVFIIGAVISTLLFITFSWKVLH